MNPYIIVEKEEATNQDGSIKEGYEQRTYCYVKLIPLTAEEVENQKKESLIQAKIRELAITALKTEGKLDKDGKINK